jgi:hypothetical protein
MRSSSLALALVVSVAAQEKFYALTDTYDATNFFDKFNFITDDDPSGGYVEYMPSISA